MVARILFGVFIISFAQAKSLSTKEPKKHGHSQFSVINCDGEPNLILILSFIKNTFRFLFKISQVRFPSFITIQFFLV